MAILTQRLMGLSTRFEETTREIMDKGLGLEEISNVALLSFGGCGIDRFSSRRFDPVA